MPGRPAAMSRLLGGYHVRVDNEEGLILGHALSARPFPFPLLPLLPLVPPDVCEVSGARTDEEDKENHHRDRTCLLGGRLGLGIGGSGDEEGDEPGKSFDHDTILGEDGRSTLRPETSAWLSRAAITRLCSSRGERRERFEQA